MRRLAPALLALTLAACGALRDAFSAHARVAASAGGQDLTVEQLAGWVLKAKRVQPKTENFAALATIYVDYMVYAAAVVKGENLDDSALIIRASWPFVSQLKWDRFHDQLLQARTHLTDAQVDSAYNAGDVRLLQHILIQVPASAAPPAVEQKRALAERLRREASAARGANFAALARRYSEDPGSKAGGGYLNAVGKGQFVAPFEAAGWALPPGGITDVVRSPFGFHLIRRPPLAEVRDSFVAGLAQLVSARLDSAYVESLADQRHVKVKDGAPAMARQAFADVEGARRDTRVLVTYAGGAFRVKDLVRWILAINPEEVRGLPSASDDQLRQFLRAATERDLLLARVDSAGTSLSPASWQMVKANHDSTLHVLNRQFGLSSQAFGDSAPSADAKLRLAAAHVNDYMGHVLAGEAAFFPVPPFLAAALREREPWSINTAGVVEAVERAQTLLGESAAPGSGMRRAAGPPPVPVDTSLHRTVR